MERPHSRYTREKTQAAFHSQHINAGYAIVPGSATNNSVDVVWCGTQAKVKELEKTFSEKRGEIEEHYNSQKVARVKAEEEHHRYQDIPYGDAITAVMLAKSSDYHHYHLSAYVDTRLVICGLHDSYLQVRVLEMRTNKLYEPRATVKAISTLVLGKGQILDHNILIGALVCGDRAAIAYRDDKSKMSRWTRNRIIQEVHTLQHKRYQGRPLAFLDEEKRKEIGSKISYSLIKYHARRKAL